MTKAEVIAKLTKKTGMDKLEVQVIVEGLFELIKEQMLLGETIHFKGFGKFFNKKRKQKIARNLADNTAIVIGEHYVPVLKPSKAFMQGIKEKLRTTSR